MRELANSNLRSLQVCQDAHVAAKGSREATDQSHPGGMFLGTAMGEIHPDHVNAGSENLLKDGGVGGGWAKGRDNLGRTMHGHE